MTAGAGGGLGRWLVPLGAAVAVLATVLVPTLVGAPSRAGGGPSPDRTTVDRLPTPDRLVLPSPRPGDRRDSRVRHGLEITGYQGAGRRLTLFYRVGPRSDCSAEVRRPQVTELEDRVAVRLVRADTQRPEELCDGQALASSVDVLLEAPVGGRLVQDSTRRDALVPLERPFRSTS